MTERLGTINVVHLHEKQIETINRFFGEEILPIPPIKLTQFIERTGELGFTFEPYLSQANIFLQILIIRAGL